MKVRNGFVSNSSSSSFIMYGTMITIPQSMRDNYDKLDEFYEEMDAKYTKEYMGNTLVVGCPIMREVENESIQMLEVPDVNKVDGLIKLCAKYDIDISNNKFGFVAGAGEC